MFEFVNSLRCMLQASLMALIIATCVERVLAADGAGQPPNPQASGYGRGLVGMSQTPLVPPPMNETPQNIKPPPAIQQLCGITSVPHEPSNLVGVLGPVRYERISTGRLAYIRFGNTASTRPPILYIEDFGSTLHSLPIELAVSLAKNQEFIAFDNRGQGLSIEYNTTEPLTIQGMANDTMELINALNLTRPTVFGYSMGGMIATDLVAEYGPSLGLVIVASGSAGGPQSMPPTEEATAVLINPNATERDSLSLSFNLNNAHSRKAACNNYIASFYDVNSPQNGTTTRRQLGAVARWYITRGVIGKLSAVTNPVLLVGGLNDPVVPPANVRLMAQRIAKSWLTIFPGRHGALLEWANTFTALFEEFYSVYGNVQ